MADGSVKIDITADDSDVKKKLEDVGDSAKKAADGVDELADSTDGAGKGLGIVDIAAGNLVANGLSSLIGKLGESVTALFELAESTREYREDMAKLDTAFTTAGHSSETANQAYKGFYAILGESDRSVEAANHLAELTQNEQEVAKWSTIAAGVTAKFGDSLPLEGLTEAANETAKVGQVTGPLADALNWAGISEDEFNKKLAACNSEQERAGLITSTLNSEYEAAAEEYNRLTESTQAANLATYNMEQAQAALGAAVEPVTTAWTNLKANGLEAIRPVVEALANKFSGLMQWLQEHPAVLATVTGALTALGIALGVVTAAVIAQTIAQWAQNAAWLANPITWIILAIVAAVGALVGAFVYLWNNSEDFRNFFIGMWEGIKSVTSTVWDAITSYFTEAWEAIKAAWTACGEFFTGLWEGIKSVFSVVGEWFANIFRSAWNGIKTIWSAVTSFFSSIWNGIKAVFSAVGLWFSSIFSAAVNSIKSIWGNITAFFGNIWNSIKQVFANAKDTFLSIGKNIVDGIKQGIKNAWNNLVSWFTGLFGDLKAIAKKILHINSPSKDFEYIGEMIVAGLVQGIEEYRTQGILALQKLGEDMIKAMQESADKEVELLEEKIEALKKTRNDGNKDIIDAELEALDKELEIAKERQSAMSKWATTFEKQLADMTKLEEDYAKASVKINDDLAKDIQKTQETYDKAFASRVSSIIDGMDLFERYEKGETVNKKDLFSALESQLGGLEDYNAILDGLGAKKVDVAFIDYLKDMGIDAMPYLEAINSMTDEELDKYVALWSEKNRLATAVATDELATMRQETAEEIDALIAQAEADQSELRQTYRDSMIELVGEIAAGMLESGHAGVEALGETFMDYFAAGRGMMQGVMDGIESEKDNVIALMVNNMEAALKAAKDAAEINSPSKRMRDEVGKPLGEGLIVGWQNKMSAIKKAMSGDMQALTAEVRGTVSAENARMGRTNGVPDTGMSDLTRAVGIQTAGINSLAGELTHGARKTRPVIIELNGRELGRAVLDTGNAEAVRLGGKLVLGGAY